MLDILSNPIIVFTIFLLSFQVRFLGRIAKLSSNIQAEFGSSVLALFSYIVPDVLRVACQMSSVVLSKYLQSVVVCCLGCQMSFNCTVRAPSSSVTKCFQCTVRVPSIRLGKSLLYFTVTSLLMYLPSTSNLPGESRQPLLPGVS